MDHISSLECLKLDSQSEVLDKDSGENDLFLPAVVSLNCDKPIIGSKAEESEAAESEADEMETDDSDSEKLIGTQQAPSMVCSTGATTSPCQSCSLNCLCEACLEIAQSKICELICD